MEFIEQHLTHEEKSLVASFRDSHWNFMATSGMMIGNILTCPVLVSSGDREIEFQIHDNEDLVDGSYETLTKVAIRSADVDTDQVMTSEKLLVHGRGEVCRRMFLIHERLTKFRNGTAVAEISSHSGVVFKLERRSIAIQRRGFHGFDYVIHQSANFDELVFFDSASDFPHNRIVRYEYNRELISIN